MNEFTQNLVSIGFLATMIWGMLKFMLKDIHRDLEDIRGEIKDIREDMGEMREEIKDIREEQRVARLRTDHLYEIVCKLFNEQKRA